MVKNIKNEQIIDAAIRLLVAEGTAVATAKIANEAGVSNGTLFNYYKTKQDLLDAVYLNIKKEVSSHIINEAARQIDDISDLIFYIWHAYVHWSIANPAKQQVAGLLRSSQVISQQAKATVDEIFHFINERLEQAQGENLIKHIPTSFLCEIAGAQISATIQHILSNNLAGEGIEELIHQGFGVYWHGIKV